MLYRRFGTVYSRLLLSKQDEMSRMEALLNGMDKQDEAEGNERYLKSCTLDAERETTPDAWRGVSRVQLLEKLEKKALEYGMKPLSPSLRLPGLTKNFLSGASPESARAQGARQTFASRIQKCVAFYGK